MRVIRHHSFALPVLLFLACFLAATPSVWCAETYLSIRIDADAVGQTVEGVTGMEITINQPNRYFDENPPWDITEQWWGLWGVLGMDWVRDGYAGGKLTYSGTDPLGGGETIRLLDGLVYYDRPPVVSAVELTGYDGEVTIRLLHKPEVVTPPNDYYELEIILAPRSSWRLPVSTPEAQYMDPIKLSAMMGYIHQQNHPIDSVLVVRRGRIVMEEYPNPSYGRDDLHPVYSVTKSVLSALIGIGIEKGHVSGMKANLNDLFPGRSIRNLDARKSKMTLEHILTMKAGMAWDESGEGCDSDLTNLLWCREDEPDYDPVQDILDLPMAYEPGTHWTYNGGSAHLLSAVVTGFPDTVDTLSFARELLFAPLGITRSKWDRAPDGVRRGDGGLRLRPRDMARFGYLYLHNGFCQGKQIVPRDFVSESVKPQTSLGVQSESGIWHDYGYQSWWIYPNEDVFVYYASGVGGQTIYVVPELDLVVVFTADFPADWNKWEPKMLFDYIIPASNPVPPPALVDAVWVLRHLARIGASQDVPSVADINLDGEIGLAEAIYILGEIAGIGN